MHLQICGLSRNRTKITRSARVSYSMKSTMNALSISIKENDFKYSLYLWPVLLGLYKTCSSSAVKADAVRFRITKFSGDMI